MKTYRNKEGYMKRAVIAWCILNAILLGTLALISLIIGPYLGQWFIAIPLLLGVIISEWVIMAETVAPIIKDWITQTESFDDEE